MTTQIDVLEAEVAELQAQNAKIEATADLQVTRNLLTITNKQAQIANLQEPTNAHA
jgi:hypothetical protein